VVDYAGGVATGRGSRHRWLPATGSGYNPRFVAVPRRHPAGGSVPLWIQSVEPPVKAGFNDGSSQEGGSVAKKLKELTEQDLLKAGEKDYMNEAQLAFFKQRLLELRAQLLNNADDTGQHLRENEITTDPSDRATLEEEYTLELRTRDRERKLLKKVEKSLRMIDDGSYGFCEETGEPIGIPRLLARPTATLSLEAQERRERVQKLYGD